MRNIPFFISACFTLSALSIFTSCEKTDDEQEAIFELTKPEETGITFVNTIPENDTLNQFTYHYLFNGNGVATGDLNNDGLPNHLYR
ncbi:MAG: hypothetical protein ACKO6I_01630 [Sphingomonadales bacterium]